MFEHVKLHIAQYEQSLMKEKISFVPQVSPVNFLNSNWTAAVQSQEEKDLTAYDVKFTRTSGTLQSAGMGITFREEDWNPENYLFIPAAAYNGNRFTVARKTYPPTFYYDTDPISPNMPVTITDVPHLNIGEGESKIQLKAADMATPAVCVFDRQKKEGCILLFPCKTDLGYNGITIEESEDRKTASVTISAPAMREKTKYNMCTTSHPSPDRGADFQQGQSVSLQIKQYRFPCESIPELYDYFMNVREALETDDTYQYDLPYSKGMEILEEKHNLLNWNPSGGYYKVGTEENAKFQDFQSGWVGGGINIFPLYLLGSQETKERAKTTLKSILDKMQVESGFFYGVYFDGKPLGDAFGHMEDTGWLLLRKNADMLYFLIKTWLLIREDDKVFAQECQLGLIKACDAFVRLWNKYGQWGQIVDIFKETIEVGSTASAAAAIAALALGSRAFQRPDYLETAKQAGEYYYQNFTAIGLTNGGPGEILQTPDSESAFALLEGFVVLYESSGEEKWKRYAADAANQAASWCVSYNFSFPKGSEFNRLDIKTVGSVYANCQNKHSAPGICTFSGDSLLKLYRFTGDRRYLRLIEDIAHNIMQYLSREDRPIYTLDGSVSPPGFMNERVNMCDWEDQEMVGSIFYGSCWCECSAMLTVSDLPSVYVVKDQGLVTCFDAVKAALFGDELELSNPTAFDCKVTVLAENTVDFNKNHGVNLVDTLREHDLKSGEKIRIKL